MEISEMKLADIETRSAEIVNELASGGNVEELEAEVGALEERKAQILAEAEQRKAELEEVERTSRALETFEEGEKTMDLKEVRSTKEYVNAYVNWLKTGKDAEVRKVLTELADATNVGENDTVFPVPTMVEDYVATAWENDEIMNGVKKTFFRGVFKAPFEISGTDAVVHAEGSSAPTEEVLKLGIATLTPETIKKWIRLSSEQYEMGGEEFLRYIYNELAYRIVKKEAELVLDAIANAPTTSSATAPAVAELQENLSASVIATAEGLLSGEARNLVAIMNRGTRASLMALQIASGSNVGDVFDGLPVIFTDGLPNYNTASADDTYIIIGDLSGVQANFPNGDDVKFIFDEKSEAEDDWVKVVARVYGGIGVIAPNRFVRIVRTQDESEG